MFPCPHVVSKVPDSCLWWAQCVRGACWLRNRNTRPSPQRPCDHSLSQISPPFFLSTALVAINNCAVLISWMRKLLTFLTPFSEEGLCFLAPSSRVYQLVLQSQAKALLQPRSLTCSWAVQPYSKPRNLQIKVGEEDDSVKGMFSVLYHRQQPQRAKIPYLKLIHFI